VDEIGFHTRLWRGEGTIVDVGAHDGLLTLPLARLPGAQVIAFEPLPAAFARLRAAVLAEYGAIPPQITLRPEALGAAPGRMTLSVPVTPGGAIEQWASLVKDYGEFAGIATEQHPVELITLDSLALPKVTHVKVDAEGAEQEVLEGARATLARCRPVLSLEIEERHRPGATRDVPALLHGLGYALGFWLHGAMRPFAEFDPATMQVASSDPSVFGASDPYVFTFYAWPAERGEEVLAALG
jgi:FkbM family methyltransferase